MAERAIGVWLSIAARARSEGGGVAVRHAVGACGEAVSAGVALSMSASRGLHEPVLATDPRADELEELQATLGQGPSAEVIAGVGPVLEGDLAGPGAQARWPEFAPAALARGVAAVFAVPVGVGSARLGVLALYRERAGTLSSRQFDEVLLYADAVLMLALDERGALEPGMVDLVGAGFSDRRAVVHQAAGMISVQMGVCLTDALVVMRAHAYAEGQAISQVAVDVVTRRLEFTPEGAAQRGSGTPAEKGPASPDQAQRPPPGNWHEEKHRREEDE